MSKDQQINGLASPDLAGSGQFLENDAGTCALRDTQGTQPRSADVHAITAMRADLLDMSKRHGPDTAIGHRCTNMVEQLNAYGRLRDEGVRARLEKSIRRQWADLVGLTGGVQ
jgi:hypothetical protein